MFTSSLAQSSEEVILNQMWGNWPVVILAGEAASHLEDLRIPAF